MPLQAVPMLLAQYVKADMEPHVLDKFGAMIDSTVKPLQVRYGSGRSTPPLLLQPAMEASAAVAVHELLACSVYLAQQGRTRSWP